MIRHHWTPIELAALIKRYPHELTSRIAHDLGMTEAQVYQQAYRQGLKKSAAYLSSPDSCRLRKGVQRSPATQFKPGQVPHNKGCAKRRGWAPGRMAATQFPKGNRPHNWRPVGHERVTKDGYLERKVAEPKTFRCVHRLVWEAAHGPVPKGHTVVFKPGRRSTDAKAITLDCLELVTRAELMRRNSYHTRYPKEIGLAIQLRGAIVRQINKRAAQ